MSRDALTQRCRDAESGVATQVRLGDVCELNMGQSPESASYNTVTEGLPFYQGNADFGPIYPTPRVWCNSPVKIAEAGDLLVSVRAPIGALNFANERCCIGRGLAALRVKPDSDSKFIYYALKSTVLNSNQQEFVKMAINYVRVNGEISSNDIVNSWPFKAMPPAVQLFGDKMPLLLNVIAELEKLVPRAA